MAVRSGYLHSALEKFDRKRTIEACVKRLTPVVDQFDVIAFRGMSGALIAPAVADALHKGIILVRKDSDDSHGMTIEGQPSTQRYIILDDFVSSGTTVHAIITKIVVNGMAWNPDPLAVLVYRDGMNIDGDKKPIGVKPDQLVTIWTAVYAPADETTLYDESAVYGYL